MRTLTQGLRQFAHEHDDVPAFHAGFLVLTILSAALLNLGFFALLILAHMALDFVKYHDFHGYNIRTTLRGMVLESIADIALFFVALTFAVYLNHTYMLAAMSGMLRSELTLLRALGTLLPKARIMESILTVFLNFHNYIHSVHDELKHPMTRLQRVARNTIIVCLSLLVLAAFLYRANEWNLVEVLLHELVPAL